MGSQGRRKAARLFLISPTEDMYVRELCSHRTVGNYELMSMIEFSGCKRRCAMLRTLNCDGEFLCVLLSNVGLCIYVSSSNRELKIEN